ncbi:MAG: EthD domain-containing protein [Pseudomonadota bacterium]
MLKLIAYVTARPGLSRDEFINYYENNHVPLVRKLLPMVGAYRRNYVTPGLLPNGDAEVDYDAVTEIEFADKAAFDAFYETIGQPEVNAQIRADEAQFLDTEATRIVGTTSYDQGP